MIPVVKHNSFGIQGCVSELFYNTSTNRSSGSLSLFQVHVIDSLPEFYPKIEAWVENVILEEGNATILTLFVCLLTVLYFRERQRRNAGVAAGEVGIPDQPIEHAPPAPNQLAAHHDLQKHKALLVLICGKVKFMLQLCSHLGETKFTLQWHVQMFRSLPKQLHCFWYIVHYREGKGSHKTCFFLPCEKTMYLTQDHLMPVSGWRTDILCYLSHSFIQQVRSFIQEFCL